MNAIDEERFRTVLSLVPDLLSVHTANGTYLYASPYSFELFGWSPEELLGRSAYDYVHPADVAKVAAEHTSHCYLRGKPSSVRYRIRCKDGSYRWVETRSRGMLNEGQIEQIVCCTRQLDEAPVEASVAASVAATSGSVAPAQVESPASKSPASVLTRRQREIVAQLLSGRPPKDVARSLGISVHTVRNHIKDIYSKLRVRSRVELMLMLDDLRLL